MMFGKKQKTTKTILLVDDEPDTLDLLEMRLQSKGYTTQKVTSGKQALETVRKLKPEIVILDVNMPEMNGFEVLRHLKNDKKTVDVSVIMLTGNTSEQDVQAGMEFHADKYITKPFDADHLVSEIEKTFQFRASLGL